MYKWAVYLNNKCSKEQPEAWSVVGKIKKKKKRKTQTSTIVALTNWKRCPSNNPDERHKTFVSLFMTHRLSGICQTVSFSVPLVWPKRRLNVKRKWLDPERLLYPTVQTQGLASSQQSCKTGANHANCLQKAKSSMLSISSKQFTWWRKSNNSGNGGDDDIKVWKGKCDTKQNIVILANKDA